MQRRQIQYEEMPCKTILNPVKAKSMPFEWSVNPYRGCQHGCSFCYARATHSYLDVDADDTFQNRIFMKINAPKVLEEQLKKTARSKKGIGGLGRVAIGTATDPYQPAEASAKLTRRCLELLADYGVPITITTRSPLVLRDIDILKKSNVISINISMNTLEKEVWRNFEPSSPSPAKRLETIAALADADIPAGVFMAPILPMVADNPEQLETVISQAAEHGAAFVMPSYLRINGADVKAWFFQTVEQHYPHLAEAYASLYRSSHYLPPAYLRPKMEIIRGLLERYGMREYGLEGSGREWSKCPASQLGALQAAKSTILPADEPVQLSFSF